MPQSSPPALQAARTTPAAPAAAQPAAAAAAPTHRVDEEQFAFDLSLMLRSGLTLLESLRTLAERNTGPQSAHWRRVLDALQQGETLSRAMQQSGAFSTPLLACIKASELTGDLGESLQRFAANAARVRVLRTRLVSACVYPALLVSVSMLVVLFLLVYVVPRFALVLENTTHDIAPLSRLLITVGVALSSVQLPIWLAVAALVATLGVVVWRQSRSGQLGTWGMRQAARLPWMRPYVRSYGLAQLTRSSAMLVRSGVPAIKALGMCRDLLIPSDMGRLSAALAAASAGEPLSRCLHGAGLVDSLGLRVLRVSEETGQLHTALERLADVQDGLLERGLERLGRLIEPILMLGIGVVVGGIVVLMYVPIFQLASSIQ